MNDLFHRSSADDKHREVRRLVVVLVAVLVASASWYSLRPVAAAWIARTSLGCPSRAPIVAAELRGRYDTVPTDGEINVKAPYLWPGLTTYFFPEPGWILWESVREREHLRDNSKLDHWRTTFADYKFDVVGSIGTARRSLIGPAEDIDCDGRWEIVLEFEATRWENPSSPDVRRWAVVRLGQDYNEIVWMGLSDSILWSQKSTRIKPIWRDEDGDSVKELVFVTVVFRRLPQGGVGFDPPSTVAVFAWDRAGGVLQPRSLPSDSRIITWSPPGAEPVRVEQDADIESVLADLLPVPDGFGVSPTTQPPIPPAGQSDSP